MFDVLLALGIRTGEILQVSVDDGVVEPLYADSPSRFPDGIVVDGREIYWTTMGRPTRRPDIPGEAGLDYSAPNGGIHAIKYDGTECRDVTTQGAITTGKQLAYDGAGGLYFGDREGFRVSRVGTDGSGLTDLVVNPRDDEGLGECIGVAVDTDSRHLYWTQKGPAKGGRGRIFRAGLDIPPGQTAFTRTDIELLWDQLPEPIDLEIVGDYLYWTDRGAPPNGNTLNRAPVPGPGERGTSPQILGGGFAEAIGLAVDSAIGMAYVSDLGGRIWRVPAAGGDPTVLADLHTPISGIAGLVLHR
ncbi:hypothetical protein [Antrihabitans stalactiti]|uniref:3-hydroxyacyl-CoA dehydrogenase n=1 Tax=Antrihabitans stalactiti TaxID=2584121 RepID=A0A848KRM8_9NOCA|nr:hypothetical protein [Antrihabitans stalactiti]NMN99212.1 hypothetical protein [Antrihabitans stalactiti]